MRLSLMVKYVRGSGISRRAVAAVADRGYKPLAPRSGERVAAKRPGEGLR